jgi:glutamyl-tRNA synthetase
MPTYHLANVVDDYLMQISHVIRGEEWLPSAPLHYMLYKYLGWQDVMPQFAHLPLLLKPDGNGKLSKRDGDRLGFPVFPLQWTDPVTNEISSGYRERGYFPESVVNMLALLGWHPSDNQEVFSMDELVEAFTLEKVSKSGAKFDLNKALWFNQTYLQGKNVNEIFNSLEDQFKLKYGDFDTSYGLKVVELLKEKVQFSNQIVDESGYFFGMPEKYDKQVIEKKFKENTGSNLLSLSNYFIECKCFSASEFELEFKAFCEKNGLKTGDLLQPLRVAISGEAVGPPIFELLELFGNENVHKRIEKCISEINLSLS